MKINLILAGLSMAGTTLSLNCNGAMAGNTGLPNIVLILADDLGYGDVSCLNENGKIKTPAIDRIAGSGITFTDAHSGSAVCTPTRYGILTGRYSWRSTMKEGVLNGFSPALIPSERTTLASMLKKQGYQTGCSGKWHLGWEWVKTGTKPDSIDYSKPIKKGPITLGFDYFFGISASLDMPPYVYIENDKVTSLPDHRTKGNNTPVGQPGSDGSYWREGPTGSDFVHSECLPEVVKHGIRFIREKAPSEKPYFLYLALPAPHTPILPSEEFQGKSGLNTYADFVMMVDAEVGKVLNAIDQTGEKENTIIIFTSDNGCSPWADYPFLTGKGHNPSYIFRGTKADLFDGGHRIPCLVQWPSVIKSPRIVNQTICLVDMMATFAGITGYRLSDNEAEDSYSLVPLLKDANNRKIIREATVHHSINGSFTIRKGDWKLLLAAGSGGWSSPKPGREEEGLPPVQLYNMKEDPSEKTNLESKYPEVVSELKALLAGYIAKGRSTPGKSRNNDGIYPWKQIRNIVATE